MVCLHQLLRQKNDESLSNLTKENTLIQKGKGGTKKKTKTRQMVAKKQPMS
jgi:hypothetical protein